VPGLRGEGKEKKKKKIDPVTECPSRPIRSGREGRKGEGSRNSKRFPAWPGTGKRPAAVGDIHGPRKGGNQTRGFFFCSFSSSGQQMPEKKKRSVESHGAQEGKVT